MKARQGINFVSGPVFKNIVNFTYPVILMNIMQLGFNAADLIVVGRFGSNLSVGAVGATTALINLIVGLFIGLSVGVGVSAAQAIGAGDFSRIRRTVQTAFPAAAICGGALTLVGIIFSKTFLSFMKTPPEIIELSKVYLKIYFCGSIPNMIYVFGAAVLRAAGDSKRPLYFLGVSGTINVLLNLVFVAVFKLDVAGVALATVASQCISAVFVLLALTKREDACRLVFKEMKLHKDMFLYFIKTGAPAGLQGSLYSVSNVVLQAAVNSLGASAVAGCAAASSIEGFVWITTFSFNQTTVNATGQNVGAKRYDNINKYFYTCCLCVLTLGLLTGVPTFVFKNQLLSIYLKDAADIAYGAQKLSAFCLVYFLCGLCDASSGVMQGMGKSFAAMMISFAGICGLRIVWTATVFRIPELHNVFSLYLSYPVSWIVTFVVMSFAIKIAKKGLPKENAAI